MNLYHERLCLWCYEYGVGDQNVTEWLRPAKWTVIYKLKPTCKSWRGQENICDACKEDILPDMLEDMQSSFTDEDMPESVECIPYLDNPVPVFIRGDRVKIERISRPPQTGTVVHCYMSMRTFTAMANVVVDGKKWPTVYPAHILEKYQPAIANYRAPHEAESVLS